MAILADIWIVILFILILILLAISTFSFGRSVRYIEREMEKENLGAPGWDAGYGIRYFMYAYAIVLGKVHYRPLIDAESVLKHARKKDQSRAWFLTISSLAFLALICVVHFTKQ